LGLSSEVKGVEMTLIFFNDYTNRLKVMPKAFFFYTN